MNRTTRRTARKRAVVACLLLAGIVAGPTARAQDPTFVYGLNQRGVLTVGGTVLEKLPGKFTPGSNTSPYGQNRWADLVVIGAERWALRIDGWIESNGVQLAKLPFTVFSGASTWSYLAVADGNVRALRTNGVAWFQDGPPDMLPIEVSPDGLQQYEPAGYYFTGLATSGMDTFALRSDGAVFANQQLDSSVANFAAGQGVYTDSTDGSGPSTRWIDMLVYEDQLVALRTDGKVYSLSLAELAGGGMPTSVSLGDLKFPKKSYNVYPRDFYVALAVTDGGQWLGLTENGRVVHTVPEGDDPDDGVIADFPGNSYYESQKYVDLTAFDGSVWALRFDGRVYQVSDIKDPDNNDPVINLLEGRYVLLEPSAQAPDVTESEGHLPVASPYRPRLVAGDTGFIVAMLVTDVDRPAADLVYGFDLDSIGCTFAPDCLTFGEVPKMVIVPEGLTVGSYPFFMSVGDSVDNARLYKFPLRVIPANNGGKNTPPIPWRIKPVQALVGVELVVPLVAVDRDGDVLTISAVDDTKGAFGQGAEIVDGNLRWTPSFADVGKTSARIEVSDTKATRRYTVKISVVNPLTN